MQMGVSKATDGKKWPSKFKTEVIFSSGFIPCRDIFVGIICFTAERCVSRTCKIAKKALKICIHMHR